MASSSQNPSDEQWLRHQPWIRRWYLEENMTLEAVVGQLGNLDFHVTTSQLEYRVKRKWKFQKNIDKDTWALIGHCIKNRKTKRKDSEVIHSGRRVKRQKVEKETDRYYHRNTLVQLKLQRTSSPEIPTDTQVTVCTPQPNPMEFEWASTLPWFAFQDSASQVIFDMPKDLDKVIIQLEAQALIPTSGQQKIWPAIASAQFGVSKLAATIGISMPEWYPEENLRRAQCILSGSGESYLRECLLMVIYGLSNSLFDLSDEYQWQKAVAILKTSGVLKIRANLKNLKDRTINAFMENLFYATLDILDDSYDAVKDKEAITILKWLLARGQNPIVPVRFWANLDYISHKARNRPEVLEYCLDAEVDAKLNGRDHEDPGPRLSAILIKVLESDGSNEVVSREAQLLLSHGASHNLDEALHYAIRRGMDKDLIEMICQRGGSLYAELPCENNNGCKKDNLVCKKTALSEAAATGLPETQHILRLLESRNPPEAIRQFVTSDVLISAVLAHGHNTVAFLHNKFGVVAANDYGLTALHAAARTGHLSTCQLLFPSYSAHASDSAFKFSPLQIACYYRHQDVMQFLIAEGADVNVAKVAITMRRGIGDWYMHAPTPLEMVFMGTQEPNTEACAIMLLRAGAEFSKYAVAYVADSSLYPNIFPIASEIGARRYDMDAEGEITAIQQILRQPEGSLSSRCRRDAVEFLLNTGATLKGGELFSASRLGDRKLIELLLMYGARLQGGEVVAAIRSRNIDLTNFLLEHGGTLIDMDPSGTTALEAAIQWRGALVLSAFFDTVPDIYDPGSLCAAIETRRHWAIEQLVTNRCSHSVTHDLEVTAIGMALESGNLDILWELLCHPPSDKFGPMPLDYEDHSYRDPHKFERKEYSYGDHKCYLWGSPFALVADKPIDGIMEACSELLRNGFRADKLTWAVLACSNNISFAQFLLDHDQQYVNYGNEHINDRLNHWNPLYAAIGHGNKKLLTLLLRAGVDVNDHDRSAHLSRSPLQYAVELGDLEIVSCLIEKKANINSPPAPRGGATALQLAAIKGHLGIARYLIDLGAQVDAPPAKENGRTALEGAAEWGRLDMLALLLDKGAQKMVGARRQLVTAVKLATQEGHYTAVELLKESLGWSEEDARLFKAEDIESWEWEEVKYIYL
ncbi:ankyrin repeat-containing domain protein [Xylaria telfairii]|nr:ankyrin repeat-containing domain protein [Xylaria telfairii]